jgi:hypothetical protein
MLSVFTLYLTTHFLAYVLFLRHLAVLRSEKGIFLFHFIPAAFTAVIGLAYVLTEPSFIEFPAFVLILSLQGIYSLSFLELWSLAQGGYSLSVITSIAMSESTGREPDFSRLEQIGQTKQQARISGLEKLGLIEKREGSIALTGRGRIVAALLHCLLNWVDPNKSPKEPT